ncbi:MAG: TSUP family transporter [Psychrilyobacter sp.]|nr:TSUP family transporter [Psychrilyobacter sp.]
MELLLIGIGMFIAGFVDSIAGGGGLISTPILLLVGLPPHLALGTNKLAASAGTLVSSHTFFKSKKLNFQLLKMMIPFAFIGAVLGVITLQFITPNILKTLIPFMIFGVALYTIFSRKVGMIDHFKGFTPKNKTLGKILTSILGFYDGFFGPGTGTFFMFGLVKIFGFDFTVATANTKVLNLTTGIAALLTFLWNGQVNFKYGFLSAIFMILGAKLGSKMAIKNGAKFIKPIFIIMSLVMAVNMVL